MAWLQLRRARRRAMSSGARPKLKSRSSSIAQSQFRTCSLPGSSSARTSLCTRADPPFRRIVGRAAISSPEYRLVMIVSSDQISDHPGFADRQYASNVTSRSRSTGSAGHLGYNCNMDQGPCSVPSFSEGSDGDGPRGEHRYSIVPVPRGFRPSTTEGVCDRLMPISFRRASSSNPSVRMAVRWAR